MITIKILHPEQAIAYKTSPMTINLPRGELNENLQHVAQSCQVTVAYEPELLEILALKSSVQATVEDEDFTLFTGIIDTGATWTDNGLPTPIDALQIRINDNTYLLEKQAEDEVALINTTIKSVIEKICSDCAVTISPDTILPEISLKAFVMDEGTSYLQALNNLLFQHELAFVFTGSGELTLIDFSTPPEELPVIGHDKILTGFSPTRTTKKYGAIKIGYTLLTKKTDQQVYFEGNDIGDDHKVVPITVRPGQYYPYESDPVQEEREGQVFQDFANGYAESYQAYNGETKYRRSEKTSLLYTEKQRLVQDWQGSLVIARAQFQARRASVRLLNTGSQDANLMQLAIRADAWYREPTSYITTGTGNEYVYEGEYLYTPEAAEKLSTTLSRFFMGGNFKLSGRLTDPLEIGQFVHIDTGISGFTANALCLSCFFEPESEIYTVQLITYGEVGINIHRYKNSIGKGNPTLREVSILSNRIDGLITGEENISPPDPPALLTAVANMENIDLNWIKVGIGLKNTVREYVIELSKGSGFVEIARTADTNYKYIYDRRLDGYLEASDFSPWRVRVKVVNIYGKESQGYAGEEAGIPVNTDTYGTWKLSAPKITPQVKDRHITLIFAQPARADGKKVYGNIRNAITIRRPDIDTLPDEWFTPGLSLSPYPETLGDGTEITNELNYKLDTNTPEYREETYVQTMPLKGQGGDGQSIENTLYMFRVVAENEAGSSPATTVQATALCTSIVDLVNANITQKEAYVPDLSAISANLGSINQGSMGNDNNRWDLSTFVDPKGIQRWEGLFRVGGSNQYFHVNPVIDDIGQIVDYRIDFKVGKFELTSVTSNIKGEVIVMAEDIDYERTRITPTGTYYEYLPNKDAEWQVVAQQTTSGLLSQILYSNQSLLISNSTIDSRRKRGLDIGRVYLSDNTLVYHFDTDLYDQHGTNPVPYTLDGQAHLVDASDNSPLYLVDFTPAILAVAPYSNIGKSAYGKFTMTYPLDSPEKLAIDFWVQTVWAQDCRIFMYGNDEVTISLFCIITEPHYNVPKENEPPYNYEIEDTDKLPYNVTVKLISYLDLDRTWTDENTGKTLSESQRLYLEDYGLEIVQNTWVHIGIGKTVDTTVIYINDKAIPITNEEFMPEASYIMIGDKNSIQLDELMVDTTVTLDANEFFTATTDKVPWGTLDYRKKHFLIDADDPDTIQGNFFYGKTFQEAVQRLFFETTFENAVATAINKGVADGRPGIGHVYIQFRGESAPADLYPGTSWKNITSDHKGMFFRAEGGSAAAFGGTQSGGLPNITGSVTIGEGAYFSSSDGCFLITRESYEEFGSANSGYSTANFNARRSSTLYGEASEVRPVNETIRIWKRTA